jgi:hypothetical protein
VIKRVPSIRVQGGDQSFIPAADNLAQDRKFLSRRLYPWTAPTSFNVNDEYFPVLHPRLKCYRLTALISMDEVISAEVALYV